MKRGWKRQGGPGGGAKPHPHLGVNLETDETGARERGNMNLREKPEGSWGGKTT